MLRPLLFLVAFFPLAALAQLQLDLDSEQRWSVLPPVYIDQRSELKRVSSVSLLLNHPLLTARVAVSPFKLKVWLISISPLSGPLSLDIEYDDQQGHAIAGMTERDPSFMGGASLKLPLGPFNLMADWHSDISGNSGGQVARFGFSWPIALYPPSPDITEARFNPTVQWQYQDASYNDYYFGVRPGEALAQRPGYRSPEGVNFKVTLPLEWTYNKKTSVSLAIEYARSGEGIRKSPVVERGEGLGLLFYIKREFDLFDRLNRFFR